MVHWRRPSGLQSGRMYRKLHASVYRKRSMSKVFRERRSPDIRYPQTKHRILQQDAPLQALCGAREADGPAWRWGVRSFRHARPAINCTRAQRFGSGRYPWLGNWTNARHSSFSQSSLERYLGLWSRPRFGRVSKI